MSTVLDRGLAMGKRTTKNFKIQKKTKKILRNRNCSFKPIISTTFIKQTEKISASKALA